MSAPTTHPRVQRPPLLADLVTDDSLRDELQTLRAQRADLLRLLRTAHRGGATVVRIDHVRAVLGVAS